MAAIRWKCLLGKSLAWWLFKAHHTHFNDIFWNHRAASVHAFSSTRGRSRTDATELVFPYAKGNRRIAPTLGQWAAHYDDFERWTRNAGILAIAGYLETYIAQISTAALESSPALLIGGSKEIDGVSQLKRQNKYNFYSHAEPLVRGDWQKRISAYKDCFGSCPFEAHLSDLEKLRKLRNNSGHAFGRDISIMRFAASTKLTKLPKLTDDQLQNYLGLAEDIANMVEVHLAQQFVGAYELFKILHAWINQPAVKFREKKLKARLFCKHLGTFSDKSGFGIDAAIDLINYYEKA